MKSLPLYIGGLLVAAAIAGAAASLLRPAPSPQPVPAAARTPPARSAEPPEKPQLSPEEVQAQDEEDIMLILLDQVAATPASISASWIKGFCTHIAGQDSLARFWSDAIERGRAFDAVYLARHQADKKVLSRNPLYYVFEAREFIHTQVPNRSKLEGDARKLLDMAVYRSWVASRDELRKTRGKEQRKKPSEVVLTDDDGSIDDDVKTAYFLEILQLYDLLASIEKEAGGNLRQHMDTQIRLHEAAIVDRWLLAEDLRRSARDRYRGSTQSSAPATVVIARWEAGISEHLLALGKIYVDAAVAEKAYKGRQQVYAEKGFAALAMVFQRNKSAEALRVMREANRIHRYNLWQMARVSLKQARAAVAAGDQEAAADAFLMSKQRYLQCLARLERSKKPVVLKEYQTLQAEIHAWMQAAGDTAVIITDAGG